MSELYRRTFYIPLTENASQQAQLDIILSAKRPKDVHIIFSDAEHYLEFIESGPAAFIRLMNTLGTAVSQAVAFSTAMALILSQDPHFIAVGFINEDSEEIPDDLL